MKRSLLITLEFPPQHGGVATMYYQIAKQLGGENIVVVAPVYKNSEAFDKRQNFKIIRTPALNAFLNKNNVPILGQAAHYLKLRQELKKLISTYHIELVHVGQVLPLGTIVKTLKTPYLVYTHGLDVLIPQTNSRKKLLLKKCLGAAEFIVANSYFTKDHITKLGIDENKTIVVYPCPNISAQTSQTQLAVLTGQLGLHNKQVLLTVGRLVKRKGHDAVLQALAKLKADFPNLRYLIVGSGPELTNLKQLAKQLAVFDRVCFVTEATNAELAGYYELCDIFVMPNRQIGWDVEGFGIVFLEAALFAKPVIGGDNGGVSEAIVDGKTGILVKQNQPEEVTKAIERLLRNPDLASRLGLQGLDRAAEQFTWHQQTLPLINRLR